MRDADPRFDWVLAADRFEKVWFPRLLAAVCIAGLALAVYLLATGQ